jgi:histidinol-phosphatase
VSSVAALDDAQISFAWDTKERYDADGTGDKLLALAHRCWRTRGLGDFWQHTLVAEGAVDVSIDPIVSLWDIAALIPIIVEAGGKWTTIGGASDLDADSFVCTNGRLHDVVLAALA